MRSGHGKRASCLTGSSGSINSWPLSAGPFRGGAPTLATNQRSLQRSPRSGRPFGAEAQGVLPPRAEPRLRERGAPTLRLAPYSSISGYSGKRPSRSQALRSAFALAGRPNDNQTNEKGTATIKLTIAIATPD